MGRLSDVRERLSCFPEIQRRIETLRAEMDQVAADSPAATLVRLWCTYGSRAGRYLPISLAPILDRALIGEAIAIGWHSTAPQSALPDHLTDGDNRLLMGRLIHATKQYDQTMWAADAEDIQAMGSLAAWALATTRFGREVDLIVSVPSSRGSNTLPYRVSRDVSFLTGIRYAPAEALRFGRDIPQVKTMADLYARREMVDGSMDADPAALRGRSILLIDDVCRSSTTLHECARACFRAGAISITALALSKTWEYQHIPKTWHSGSEIEP